MSTDAFDTFYHSHVYLRVSNPSWAQPPGFPLGDMRNRIPWRIDNNDRETCRKNLLFQHCKTIQTFLDCCTSFVSNLFEIWASVAKWAEVIILVNHVSNWFVFENNERDSKFCQRACCWDTVNWICHRKEVLHPLCLALPTQLQAKTTILNSDQHLTAEIFHPS